MSAITGIINFKKNLYAYKAYNRLLVKDMSAAMEYRGGESEEWVGEHIAFSHLGNPKLHPIKKTVEGYEFAIASSGNLFNADELRADLKNRGYVFETESDAEVILYCYIHYGDKCCEKLNGAYAFAIWDSMRQQVFFCRDRFGIKPFFYTLCGDTLVFASEAKAIFRYPYLKPKLDCDGLCKIFTQSPLKKSGESVFYGISELPPAHIMIINRSGIKINKYWQVKSCEHTESYDETTEHLCELINDAVKIRLCNDTALLDDGVNSDLVSTVISKENKIPQMYSFDYKNHDINEKSEINRIVMSCPCENLLKYLYDTVLYYDLPGMNMYNFSLLYVLREMGKNYDSTLSVIGAKALSGSFNDEFIDLSALTEHCNLHDKIKILKPAIADTLNFNDYIEKRYNDAIKNYPFIDDENNENKKRWEFLWLNFMHFIPHKIEKIERLSAVSGVDVRFPFCDYRLFEYVWNIPYSMKNALNEVFPKTFSQNKHPKADIIADNYYPKAVRELMYEILNDCSSPVLAFVDKKSVENICDEMNEGVTEFMEYLIQIDYWLQKFKPTIV